MRLYIPAPYYGFNHEQVKAKFDGAPIFLNEMCIFEQYQPVALYYVEKPNRKLGHKKFMYLYTNNGQLYVGGATVEKMKKYRTQQGMYCPKCDSVIYSINRHDYHHCACGEVMVDGGRDYLRSGGNGYPVLIDLFKNRVKFYRKYYHNAGGRHAPKNVRANKWYDLETGSGLDRAAKRARA